MTFVPEGAMVSCGVNAMLNTVPLPELPPALEVPYKTLFDKINLAYGAPPSLLVSVKLWRVIKPVPSVLTANTVPALELPPKYVVPYKVLPDKTNPARGKAPSLEPMKLYRFVK